MNEKLCIFTGDNLRNGGKQTPKCMPPFNDRGSWTSCLLHLLQNNPYPEGFLPRSLPPQDSVTAIALTEISERFCS